MMKLIRFLILMIASVFLAACNSSSSSSKPSPGSGAETQSQIRINDIPETSLGTNLSLKEIPVGIYLFHSVRFTSINVDSDNSFQHTVEHLGYIEQNDSVLTQNTKGLINQGFLTSFPYEIHSSLTDVSFIDIRNYSAYVFEDGTWEWSLDESGKGLYCHDISNVFEKSKMAEEKIYVAEPSCNFSNYKIVFQSHDDDLYITVQEINRNYSSEEKRIQLIYKKGVSISSTPLSKVLKK